MELVDEPGALADDGLESAGDLAEGAQFGVTAACAAGSFAEGEACGGAGFDGIGLLAAEESGAIVFVALRIAAGDGDGGVATAAKRPTRRAEAVQEVEQVVGILAGGVETDDEVDGAVALGDAFEALAE